MINGQFYLVVIEYFVLYLVGFSRRRYGRSRVFFFGVSGIWKGIIGNRVENGSGLKISWKKV